MASVISYTKAKIDELLDAIRQSIEGKADNTHVHTIGQVTNLETTLLGKASTGHTHSLSQVNGLTAALDGKSSTSHRHEISHVTGLAEAIENAAVNEHTHPSSDISDAVSSVTGTANKLIKTNSSGSLTISDAAINSNLSVVNRNYVDRSAPWLGTDAEYNALPSRDPERIYIITGA